VAVALALMGLAYYVSVLGGGETNFFRVTLRHLISVLAALLSHLLVSADPRSPFFLLWEVVALSSWYAVFVSAVEEDNGPRLALSAVLVAHTIAIVWLLAWSLPRIWPLR